MKFKFKNGFLMGCASASAQIEGGEVGSNWNDAYHRGIIHDNSNPAVADDHYNLWEEDLKLMTDMKMQIARIGVEWARLTPAEGTVDKQAVAHYREEISAMRKKGIKVLLTIHHFSEPMWFAKKGGFAKRENLRYYLELVRLCVESFGDLVSEYITINEPDVYATNCYLFGMFPPEHTSFKETIAVYENMCHCHIEAYRLIHAMRTNMGFNDTKVSFANHIRVFEPENKNNLYHVICSKTADWVFQKAYTIAMCKGTFLPPLTDHWHTKKGEYSDFNAINYYSRSTISGLRDGVKSNTPRNDLDWEIYPEGIEKAALWYSRILYRPIYITENGTCDNTDSFRSRYLYDHLKVIAESPLPFERYYHWCFVDNFEWLEGESARFGLVHNDYRTQKRTVKQSGRFFTEMITNGGVSEDMYLRYVENCRYNVK